jgi:hypothetical protein
MGQYYEKSLVQPNQVKARKNLTEENQKLASKLQSACNKYISDPASKKLATGYVAGYKANGDSVVNAFLDLNYKYIAAARPYKATRSDFEPMRSRMIDLRKAYSNYLVKMRFELKAITPEKQWNDLAKELNNNFVYLGAGISK